MKRDKQDRADALSKEGAGDTKSQEDNRTYVSESDPELVAEEETVPYGEAANWGQAVGEGVRLQATRDTAEVDSASGDEEALQLVREIFFTWPGMGLQLSAAFLMLRGTLQPGIECLVNLGSIVHPGTVTRLSVTQC